MPRSTSLTRVDHLEEPLIAQTVTRVLDHRRGAAWPVQRRRTGHRPSLGATAVTCGDVTAGKRPLADGAPGPRAPLRLVSMQRRIFGLESRVRGQCHFHGQRRRSGRGGALSVSPGRVVGPVVERVAAQRCQALPGRGQPPGVRRRRVRLAVPARRTRQGRRRILEDLLVDAERRLVDEGIGGDISPCSRTTPTPPATRTAATRTTGSARAGEFSRIAGRAAALPRHPPAHLRRGQGAADPARRRYCLSQRAEHIWEGVSSATTRSRPIINTCATSRTRRRRSATAACT